MSKTFYVCSYGGAGSKMLCNALNKYGISKHIHSNYPPDKLQYLGKESGGNTYFEWFNGVEIPQDKVQNYCVIFIYRNPVNAILSRFHIPQHLANIQSNRNITREQVLQSGQDLYKLNEFYKNYTTPNSNRNYKIIAVKYEDIFDKQHELARVLGVGDLNLINSSNRKETNLSLELIYEDLIDTMKQNPFIMII